MTGQASAWARMLGAFEELILERERWVSVHAEVALAMRDLADLLEADTEASAELKDFVGTARETAAQFEAAAASVSDGLLEDQSLLAELRAQHSEWRRDIEAAEGEDDGPL